jgi:hypothetical protein
LFVHQQNIHEERERVRIDAEKKHIEQTTVSVCLNLSTQSQCAEETEAACQSNTDFDSKKQCIASAARWCPDEGTRKQCIVETLRARSDARRAAEASREQQEQHDVWCSTIEQEVPEAMQRLSIRGGLYWEWLPEDYVSRRDCANVEKAIDRALSAARWAYPFDRAAE